MNRKQCRAFLLFNVVLFLVMSLLNAPRAKAAAQDSVEVDLYSVLGDMVDQEGMFYLPEPHRAGLFSPSRKVNETKLDQAVKSKKYFDAALASLNLAWIEIADGNNKNAIEYLNNAIEYKQQLNDERGVTALKLLIGYVHYKALNYDEALKNFSSVLEIVQQNNNQVAKPYVQAMTGQAYLAKKDFDNAIIHYKIASEEFKKDNSKGGEARTKVQVAELLIRKSNFKEAGEYLNDALELFIELSDLNGQALVYRDMGIISLKQNNYTGAIEDFKHSMELSDQLSVAKLLKDTYLKLFTFKSLSGDHDASNEINILYVQLRDSIDIVERSRILNSQLTRRDLMEKEAISEMLRKVSDISFLNMSPDELQQNQVLLEAEIDRLEKEKIIEDLNMAKKVSDQANIEREEKIKELTRQKELQELAISQKELQVSRGQSLRNMLIVAFVFIIIIAVLLFTRYKNQQKSHAQLDKAYKELSDTHHQLVTTQEQLIHSQKMASLGQLTAGIAHEIQNPLNFVNNFSELCIELIEELKESDADKDEILKDLTSNLQKINTHGKRADKIVKGMLTHSRAGQEEKVPSDINKMIDELIDLSYHGNRTKFTGFSAEVIKHFDQSDPEVNIIMQDISRVLINLFNNAFYALGQRTQNEGPGFKSVLGVSTKVEDGYVVIKIRDNGTGIPEEIRQKIFDPFFTTKPAGEGTGLGLSLSYDIIVKGHNGTMEVNSVPNSFTEFIIKLPLK